MIATEAGTTASIHAASTEPHAHGTDCTWHGPAADAITVDDHGEQPDSIPLRCPLCNGPLAVIPSDDFWLRVSSVDRAIEGFEPMMRWSQGKCFPDYATREDAWRQASTE